MIGKQINYPHKSGKKGLETEEIIRSYFLEAGFFVVRGVKLRSDGDELTDIDLWLYERSATLARRRLIIDIKDNSHPKSAERLFFVKGLAEILQIEATGIVTSDNRQSIRDIARRHNVLWIDNADIQRLKSSDKIKKRSRISDEEMNAMVSNADISRSSKEISTVYSFIKSSVAERFGPSCASVAIDGILFFGKGCVDSHPKSKSAQLFARLSYFSASIAAAALDYASGEMALRPHQERLAHMKDVIKCGDDPKNALAKLNLMDSILRDFTPNGPGIAQIVREQILKNIESINADGIAEVIIRMSSTNRLFDTARELEQAAFSIVCPSFDDLSIDARSLFGSLLDYVSIHRSNFAEAVSLGSVASSDKKDS